MPTQQLTLRGHSIVAGESIRGRAGELSGLNPATGARLDPAYSLLDDDQLRQATAAAHEASVPYSALAPEARAGFLDRIAEGIEAMRESIVARAVSETGLTPQRLSGELDRTTRQLRLFGDVVRRGDYRGARIDPAQPDRTPAPRADIRMQKVPLGPVAVFGSSNFPLAFSTAGGDTASALAAGCPVVVKAHPAHPGTGELVGQAIAAAVRDAGLHPGVFSLVYGPGTAVGRTLVTDPRIKAVAFTGSRAGGLALAAAAAGRSEPIPVYAEMSSVNPAIILPGALDDDPEALATGYVASVTGSSGQLCTVPGLLFVPAGEAGDRFAGLVAEALSAVPGQTMLTPGIHDAWQAGVALLEGQPAVELVATGGAGAGENAPAPAVFTADVAAFLANPVLQREIFGAASLIIRYDDADQLVDAIGVLEGQLTATLHLREADYDIAARLLPHLERTAGRILAGGWPTGVEVGHAMVHGGPFPATTDSRTTSVGTLAIDRFLRPVCYQSLPEALLPPALRDDNPWGLTRRVDGTLTAPGGAS